MKILFQGDSITDAGRSRDINRDDLVGIGYPNLVMASLGLENPGEYDFVNRGISGDRVVDLYARIKKDILNIRPDVMSILIGVNDVWHEIVDSNGVDAEKYYKVYSMLIEEIKKELPDIKIMILEPFVLKAAATTEEWNTFLSETQKRAQMAKKVAEEFELAFVPLQDGFDKLTEKAPADYWLRDGVHPTAMGHEYIKAEWIRAFKTLINTNMR